MAITGSSKQQPLGIPPDDRGRKLSAVQADARQKVRHIGVVGDTYTILLAGEDTAYIPANAPHQFRNASAQAARMLCICSPAGQENFFVEVGVPVATRTTAPPKLDDTAESAFRAKAAALAPKYRTELLQHA